MTKRHALMSTILPVLFLILLVAALVAPAGAAAAGSGTFHGGLEPQNWTLSGPGSLSVQPSSGATNELRFTYVNNGMYGQWHTWYFTATATSTETLNFDWQYLPFHSWYMAQARLYMFNDGTSGPMTTLYDGYGQVDVGGSVTVGVTAGKVFGFKVQAWHYDGSRITNGTLILKGHAPSANAGGPYSVNEGSSVQLNGSGSDPDGNPVTLNWDLDNDGQYDDATGATTTFNASSIDGPSTRNVGLQVTEKANLFWDFENSTSSGGISTSVGAASGSSISGTASQTGGGPAENFAGNIGIVSLTRYMGPVNYPYIEFTTTEKLNLKDISFWHLHNHNPGFPTQYGYQVQLQLDSGNGYINIGSPLTVNSNPANNNVTSTIALGSTSLNPGTYRIRWFASGFSYGDNSNTEFFALNNVTLNLTGVSTGTSLTTVTVNNVAPTAEAGGPYTGNEGALIALSGSATDPGADTLTYAWDLDNNGVYETAGQNVSRTWPAYGTYTVRLRVTDDDGGTGTDTAVVTVNAVPPHLNVSGSVTYTENAPSVVVAPGLTLTGSAIYGAKASITGNFISSQDRLGISGQGGTSGTISGINWSYNAGTGILSLSGTASTATYQSVLRQVTYSNSSEIPFGARTVNFSIGQNSLYFEGNGHYYEYVPAPYISWPNARTAASARSLYGLQGYLVTITSAAENSFVTSKLQGMGWMGSSDEAVEGTWRWVTGPENGALLSYTHWAGGEPNNAGNEDYGHFYTNGLWNDFAYNNYNIAGYVVEYGGMPGDPVLSLNGNATVIIQPVNDLPSADAGGPYFGNEGSALVFDGRGSSDPESGALAYVWTFGDGGTGVGPTPSHAYADNGMYTVILTVNDGNGGVGSDTATVTVYNMAPTAEAGGLYSGNEGAPIAVSGSATDPGADTFTYAWDLDNDGVYETSGQNVSRAWPDNGVYVARLRVTDDDGGVSTDIANVTVNNMAPVVNAGFDTSVGEGSTLTLGAKGLAAWYEAEGDARDSAGVNEGVASGGLTWAAGKMGKAFDNVSGYVDVPDSASLDATTGLTIDAWIYPRSLGGRIVDKITAGGNDGYMLDTWNGRLRLIAGSSVVSSASLPTNTWVHVAGVYTGSQLNLYINGVLSGTASVSAPIPTNNLTLRIGNAHGDAIPFNGLIDEVHVYNRALSAFWIQGLAAGNLAEGVFTDPGADTWTATVNYGDGSGTSPLALSGKTFSLSHTYADNGNYTVTVVVTDDDGGVGGDTLLVTVNNVTPTAEAGGPYTGNEGASIALSGNATDPGADALSYAWDLDNDGVYETAGQNVSRTWPDSGTYTVGLRVTDDDGGAGTDTATVTVNNLPPDLTIAGANSVFYVDWTSANVGGGTASGVIRLPDGSTVDVSFQAINPNGSAGTLRGAQTNGGTNYWVPTAPYISAQVPNAPPDSDILQLEGGQNQTYRVTLSQPIRDPIMAIVSLGSGANSMYYDFDSPFTIVSQGYGYFGGGSDRLAQLPGDILRGTEGHGTIKFLGTFTTFSWTVPYPENWHGFTFGVRTTDALAQTVFVNEGQTAANSGTWSDPSQDQVTLSASAGAVTGNADGAWTWSMTATDGPSQSQTVVITAVDEDGGSTSRSFPLVVNNVAPVVNAGPDSTINQGDTFTRNGDFTDPGADTWTATVDYGDGSGAQSLALSGKTFMLTHAYPNMGVYTVSVTVTDDEGAAGSDSVTVRVFDNVAPVTTIGQDPAANAAGWNNSNVILSLSAVDNAGGSGVKEIRYRVNGSSEDVVAGGAVSIPFTADGVYTVVYYARDNAGNSETARSLTVRIDKTAPVITAARTPTNANGWNHGDVAVEFSASDSLSGVASVTPNTLVSSEGAGQSVTGTVTDLAGNSASVTVNNINIDKTAPVITATRTLANAIGWNNGDVAVAFAASDGLSGVASVTPDAVVTAEGAGQSVTGTAVDLAGNSASVTFGSINIDKTAPVITATRTPANAAGWNNGDVAVDFSATDSLSGVASVTPNVVVSSEGAGQSVNGTVTDLAGNSASVTVGSINIDKTAPVITATRTPANANGWNNDDVAVDFAATDSLSGVASVTPDAVVTAEGAGQSVTGTAVDLAGNSASVTVGSINIDKTAPVITATRTPANANGWNNDDVAVDFAATDSLSGVASVTPNTLVSSEGAGQSVNGTVTDLAGNSSSVTVGSINIDKTAPVITATRTPANAAGWNNGDVAVDFSASDSLSGVATVTPDKVVATEGAGQSVNGTVTDLAGNSASVTVGSINIDKTAPVITATRTPANAAGWNNGDVTVDFTASDTLSGVATVTPDIVVTAEGAGQTVSGTATDLAGNSSSVTVSDINIDKTASTLAFGAVTPAPNAAGWNNTDVQVDYTPGDALSGVDYTSTPSPLSFTTEGNNLTQSVTVTDKAGNSQTFVSPVVRLDKTAPVVTITSPQARSYLTSETITLDFGSADALSGVSNIVATLDGNPVSNGQVIGLAAIAGSHTITVTATDTAGNSQTESTTFVVVIDSTVVINPDTLNLKSKSDKNAVTVYVEFPAGYDVSGIDVSTAVLNVNGALIMTQITPSSVGDNDGDGVLELMVKFDRMAVIAALGTTTGDIQVTLSGQLGDGRRFAGSDTIKVINPTK